MKTSLDRYGYPRLSLMKDDGGKWYLTVHIVVAMNWVKGYEKGLQVNHIDGVKTNNNKENLEWVSAKKNIIHSYETRLNKNANRVFLTDFELGAKTEFISIKSLAKHLGIWYSALIPLIRNSPKSPILGRYMVELEDESDILNPANTINFGRSVNVFDHYKDEWTIYPSAPVTAYFTGIRSLSNLGIKPVTTLAGYSVSFEDFDIPDLGMSKSEIMKIREEYLNKPYQPRDFRYYIYDYWKKEEYEFSSVESLCDYINKTYPDVNATEEDIRAGIYQGQKHKKSGLAKGFGVQSDKNKYSWYPYTEEILLRSKFREHFYRGYRITHNSKTNVVFGTENVLKQFGHSPDKLSPRATTEEIKKFLNIPNLHIERLNKPIA